MPPDTHLSDQELVMAADGEMPERRLGEVRTHLAACWTCRARMREIEGAIAAFSGIHSDSPLPPADGPRALLRARLAGLSAEPQFLTWRTLFGFLKPHAAWASLAIVLLAISAWMLPRVFPHRSSRQAEERLIPDPRLTPGAVVLMSAREVCSAEPPGKARLIPAALAKKVFAEYGIQSPQPRAYELDYLVAPELGGSDDIRNFWPQPYSAAVWNARVKDALEDRLHELVCSDQISLSTAQRDIAANWVSAYKRYFKTETPLPDHYAFNKDQPWEQ